MRCYFKTYINSNNNYNISLTWPILSLLLMGVIQIIQIGLHEYLYIFARHKHDEQISEYIRKAKRCRMNIRIYSEERKETNINESE